MSSAKWEGSATLMQAATGRIVSPFLGPFAVHDIFPFSTEPVVVYDLVLWKQNHYVGLDTFAEIRAGEDSDAETDPITERLHWRALCSVNILPEGGDDLLPRFSQQGGQLVKAFATSQRMELEASIEVLIQGITRQYRWDYNATPPSLIVYSLFPDGNHQKFRVLTLEAKTLHNSLMNLQVLSLLKRLRTNKSNTGNTTLDWIIESYKQEFPREREYQEPDNKRNPQIHRSHIRTAFLTPFSMKSSRKIMQDEGLIAHQDRKKVAIELRALAEAGHLREAPPTKYIQPRTAPRSSMETDPPKAQPTTLDQIDAILDSIPQELFLFHAVPAAGQNWVCGYKGCVHEIPSMPYHRSAEAADTEVLRLRQAISKHVWDHASNHLSQDSLGKLGSYLAHVESEDSLWRA